MVGSLESLIDGIGATDIMLAGKVAVVVGYDDVAAFARILQQVIKRSNYKESDAQLFTPLIPSTICKLSGPC
jgi:S-adenosylhomocysteine hydrolase